MRSFLLGTALCVVAWFCLPPTAEARQAGGQTPSSPSAAQSSQKPPDGQDAKDSKQPAADQTSGSAQAGANPSQQNSNSGQGTGSAVPSAQQTPGSPTLENGTSNDRLFWTLPNFLTVETANQIPPLTPGEKFKVVARGTFDPVEFAYIGFVSAIAQADNSEPSYGQGWAGYGKRYGTAFGDNAIENFMTGAVLPSLLHQDPRYYQLGKGSFLHRTAYALGRIFITRTDSGQKQFNYSEIFGAAIAAGISTYSYHPHSEQNVDNACSVWGTQIGWDALSTELKEFWPDIRRKFHKKHVN